MRLVAAFCLVVFSLTGQSDLRGLLEDGQYRRAESIAKQRLQSNPNDSEAYYAISLAQYRADDLQRALDAAEKAAALNPKDAEYHSLLGQIIGSQAARASVFRQLGLAKRCKGELETALSLDPRHYEANTILMLYLLKAPSLFGGDKARARSIPDAISKYDPSNGFLAKARLLRESDSKADVTGLYREAAEANPKNFGAQTAYLRALLQDDTNLEEVERRARGLVQMFPQRQEGYEFLASRYAAGGYWDQMESTLREGRKQSPNNLAPFVAVARRLARDGKELNRAEGYLKLYLSQEPEYAAPAHYYAHWLLGIVFEKQQRKPDAIAQMEKALTLKPDFDDAKKDLKRLRG